MSGYIEEILSRKVRAFVIEYSGGEKARKHTLGLGPEWFDAIGLKVVEEVEPSADEVARYRKLLGQRA